MREVQVNIKVRVLILPLKFTSLFEGGGSEADGGSLRNVPSSPSPQHPAAAVAVLPGKLEE
jgi:hypothetical protein